MGKLEQLARLAYDAYMEDGAQPWPEFWSISDDAQTRWENVARRIVREIAERQAAKQLEDLF